MYVCKITIMYIILYYINPIHILDNLRGGGGLALLHQFKLGDKYFATSTETCAMDVKLQIFCTQPDSLGDRHFVASTEICMYNVM